MKVLLIGVGMQGKTALYDLFRSEEVDEILAADKEIEPLEAHLREMNYGEKVRYAHVDADNPENVHDLMADRPDVVIDLLPVPFHDVVCREAVEHSVHVVNASYPSSEIRELSEAAEAKKVAILPEFGMDPGIDLVLLGEAVRSLDSVEEIISYGAGFPEAEAANNPLKYKVTWNLEGVFRSYRRPARLIRDGEVIEIDAIEILSPENIHEIEIEGLGVLEAFPNGDALKYVGPLGLDVSELRNMKRCVLRWPGHSAFWKKLIDLHLLDDAPLMVDGTEIDRRRFLAAAIEPYIHYGPDERDVVAVRVEVSGKKNGRETRLVYQVIDRRDLTTGHTAMSRTVGYTASIGALMIGAGRITKRGILSPLKDVPYKLFTQELAKRGIKVTP